MSGCLSCGKPTRASERTGKPLKYCDKKCANKVLHKKYYPKKNPDWGKQSKERQEKSKKNKELLEWCQNNLYTIQQIEQTYNISRSCFHYRAARLGIEGTVVHYSGKKLFFSEEDIKRVLNYNNEEKTNPLKKYGQSKEQKERYRAYNRKYRAERRKCPTYRMRCCVSGAVLHALKKQGKSKEGPTFSALPYTPMQLKKHIEKQFDDTMTWENYGEHWEVDHIIPQAALQYDSFGHPNFLKCWRLENLRPLACTANRSKSNLHRGKRHFYRKN